MRIKKLHLNCTDIKATKQFYTELLGFSLVSETKASFAILAGESELEFKFAPKCTPYHFAFNIPSNKIEEALIWAKQRVKILPHDTDEIQHFEDWQAKAIYFYDPDQNIVEYIARAEIEEFCNKPFSIESVLSISEIGIPSKKNEVVYDFLVENCGLTSYRGTRELFTAIGDPRGLFICINYTSKKWFPMGEEAFPSDFKVHFMDKGRTFHLQYRNGVLSKLS